VQDRRCVHPFALLAHQQCNLFMEQEDALAANRRAQEAAGGGAASSSSAAPDENGVNGHARANGHATSATASSSGAVLTGSHDAFRLLVCRSRSCHCGAYWSLLSLSPKSKGEPVQLRSQA